MFDLSIFEDCFYTLDTSILQKIVDGEWDGDYVHFFGKIYEHHGPHAELESANYCERTAHIDSQAKGHIYCTVEEFEKLCEKAGVLDGLQEFIDKEEAKMRKRYGLTS